MRRRYFHSAARKRIPIHGVLGVSASQRVTDLPKGCPSCASMDLRPLGRISASNVFAGQELEEVFDGGTLWMCQGCSLYFRWPRFSEEELAKLYMEGNPQAWHSGHARNDWTTAARWLNGELPHNGSVLDVGCSTGQFLTEVLGEDFKKYGIEMNLVAASVAQKRGVCIVGADILDSALRVDQSFFAVTAFDVIEHVHDPLSVLNTCRGLVQPGGRIIVSSGNTDARSWRWSGSRYWYCAIPEHISFINEKWCQYAAERLNLQLGRIHLFSHAHGDIVKRMREFVLNSVSIVAPGVCRAFRRAGWGRKNVRAYPEMADHPPSWMTARDHLLVEFRRPCENGLKGAARHAG